LKTIRSKKEALISACGRNGGFEVIESLFKGYKRRIWEIEVFSVILKQCIFIIVV